jgi:DsbC/DsbD-like thiol-disulfide interchange protein
MFLRACSVLLVAGFASGLNAQTKASASHSSVEIIASRSDIRAREPLWVALRITPKPGWHTYWKNPGDAGMPPSTGWSFPTPQWSAEELQWPAPERIPVKRLASYGYNGTLVLPQRLFAPPKLAAGTLALKLRVDWLVCEDSCIAQDAELSLPLTATAGAPRADSNAAAATIAQSLLKTPVSNNSVSANASRENGQMVVRLSGLATPRGELFFETEGLVEPGVKPQLTTEATTTVWQAPLAALGKTLKAPSAQDAVWVPADGSRAVRLRVMLREKLREKLR